MSRDDLDFSDNTLPADDAGSPGPPLRPSRTARIVSLIFPVLVVLAIVGYFVMRHSLHKAMRDALPQLDGSIPVPAAGAPFFGLAAPVTVERDARGVPHIRASSMDDLI